MYNYWCLVTVFLRLIWLRCLIVPWHILLYGMLLFKLVMYRLIYHTSSLVCLILGKAGSLIWRMMWHSRYLCPDKPLYSYILTSVCDLLIYLVRLVFFQLLSNLFRFYVRILCSFLKISLSMSIVVELDASVLSDIDIWLLDASYSDDNSSGGTWTLGRSLQWWYGAILWKTILLLAKKMMILDKKLTLR